MLGKRCPGALLILVAVAGVAPAAGQDALVLSTGAARGLAHAGVVAGVERRGYDPDLVVGASMGAVIGGLYASGYTPDEIRALLDAADWADVFKPVPLLLGPGGSVRIPLLRLGVALETLELDRGFAPDWRVNRLMVRFFFDAGARSGGDFDRLARRFRAVAADLETGEEVVIAGGDLARAVRASLGIPGLFTPIEWDGRLLADGGVANYLPISVARDLGASTVVAADVSRPPPWVEETSPVRLLGRGIGLLMRNAAPDTVPDVLVRPKLDPGMSSAAFPDDPGPLIELGFEAAMAALPPGPDRVPARTLPPPPDRLGALVVESPDAPLRALTRRLFGDVAPGPYEPSRVLEAVDRLYATGLVAGVWPRVESRDAEGAPAPTLVVRVDPIPRISLAAAAGYDNDRGGRGWVELQRRFGVGSLPAEVMVAGSVDGLDRWAELSTRLHVGRSRALTLTASAHGRETDVRIFDDDPETGDVEVWRLGGALGAEYRRIFPDRIALLSVQAEHVDAGGGQEGVSAGPRLLLTTASAATQVVGIPTELVTELRMGEIGYGYAAFRGSFDGGWRGFRAAVVADLAVAEKDAPIDVRPALGDGHAVPGFAWGEERGRARVVLGVDLAYPVVFGGAARLRLRGGAAPDALGDLDTDDPWVGGVALEGVWTAPIGSIVVGAGLNTRGGQRLDVSVGGVF